MVDVVGWRRSRAWMLVLLALVAGLLAVPASSPALAQESPGATYLLRHVASGQFLALDGWGPSVLAARFEGRMAQWERVDEADGTVRFQHSVTGAYLDRLGGRSGHDVGVSPDAGPTTAWTLSGSGSATRLVNGGVFLVANGFTVRTDGQAGPQADWELVEVTLEAPRYVTLTNDASARRLAAGGPDRAVVTIEGSEEAPAVARWEFIEQVTTNAKCDRHPDWNIPNDAPPAHGDTSRVTTCHILRTLDGGEALEADSVHSDYAVTTQDGVTHDAYWVVSDVADGALITLENVAFARFLTENAGRAVTDRRVGASSWWRLNDVSGACEPLDEVLITSHESGAVVDTTESGTATGSFLLAGTAPRGTTGVIIEVEGETAGATLDPGDCAVAWSMEVLAVATQDITISATAAGGFGQRQATVDLNVIAPDAGDILVQPIFANTPQFHDLLLSFDPATGVLVFAGDVSAELQPGDGLGGGMSEQAPDGYLRIVESVAFDGTNTIVTTRQAGLTELVRQLRVEYLESMDAPRAAPSSTERAPGDADEPVDNGGVLPEDAPTVTTLDALELAPAALDINGVDLTLDLNIDPGADFGLDISWSSPCWICPPIVPSVDRFAFEVRLDLSAQIEIAYEGATLVQGSGNFGPRLDDFRFATITIPTPIGVPVVITFEAESQPFYEYSLDALIRVEYSPTISLAVGFEHEKGGSGRGAYRDADADAGFNQLEFDLGIRGTAAVGVEIDVEGLLYGQAGIELEARPQLELEAIGDVIDREVNWELNLVVPFSGGIEIEIKIGPVGWELEAARLEFLTISFTILSGTFGGGDATLELSQVAPPGVFPNQEFAYTVTVRNTGDARATGVRVDMVLPDSGAFVSSTPSGLPSTPPPGGNYAVRLDDLDPNESATVTLRWRAPGEENTVLANAVTATADNASPVGPVEASTVVGVEGRCNPCGVAAAGVGLRNRAQGTIPISGLPEGAVVTRAVLTWGVLYTGAVPRDTITFNGNVVTADVAATVSGNLCWADSNTIGYSADVTAFVQGNGTYTVSDPPRGITRVDGEPAGVLPYTDGASLIVFYVGGGANSQVISDFSYNTNTDASGTIVRSFTGVNSVGSQAWLTVAGPDGQSNASEVFTISGAGTPITLFNTHDGSDPQEGPAFAIGSLWDTDRHEVTSVLPAGQTELSYAYGGGTDCIGVSAAVLEVKQS